MLRKLKNPFGLVNGNLYHVNDISKECEVLCPVCNKRLIVRDGDKMIKHLSHGVGDDEECCNESIIHKYTKIYLFEKINYLRIRDHKIEFKGAKMTLSDPELLEVKNKYLEHRCLDASYIPDIYMVLEGNYHVAIEVCYKNPKNQKDLRRILDNSKIGIVIEIQVTEDDLSELNLDDLLSRSSIIYNEISQKYTKARTQILNKNEENKYLKATIEGLPIEENERLKKNNAKLRKKLKEQNVELEKSKTLVGTVKDNANELKEQLEKYKRMMESEEPYYKEFLNSLDTLQYVYNMICEKEAHRLSGNPECYIRAKESIKKTWVETLRKIQILIDGYRDIDSEISFGQDGFINQVKLKNISDDKRGVSVKEYKQVISPIIEQIERSGKQLKLSPKLERYKEDMRKLEEVLEDKDKNIKYLEKKVDRLECNNRELRELVSNQRQGGIQEVFSVK